MLTRRWAILRGKEEKAVKDLKETTLPYEKLAKKYGVSRQAIQVFCKKQGIKRPKRPKGHQTEGNRGLKMSRPIGDRIPVKILKEIFPEKLNRSLASEKVYSHLKQMIISGKVKKGKRLVREKIAQTLGVQETTVSKAFSHLKKDRLIIVKHRGSFVA
jgi:DNA-binding transcriptional regulator YhcF (GntR family)